MEGRVALTDRHLLVAAARVATPAPAATAATANLAVVAGVMTQLLELPVLVVLAAAVAVLGAPLLEAGKAAELDCKVKDQTAQQALPAQ